MDKTPQLIQLAFAYMQVLPEIQHHAAAVLGRPIQPRAGRILVKLHNPCSTPQGIAFRQRTDRRLKNAGISFQFKVGRAIAQEHTPATGLTQRLFVASTGAVLDQCAVPERHAIEAATTIRTIECFPIHRTLVSRTGVFGRGYPRTGLRTKFHQGY